MAVYLYNCPEYLEATFAAIKVGLVPVNTNYRYGDDELIYLWENADAVAVVFHGAFADRIEGILDRVPGVKGWLWVDDGSGPAPTGPPPTRTPTKSAVGRHAGTVGPQRRRPLHALHRRHHRHAQGRHVAPGRPLRPAHRRRGPPLPTSTAGSTACASALEPPARAGRHPDARLPAHARDRRVHREHDASAEGGRVVPARVAASTTRSSCSTRSSARRSTASSSSATPSPARCWPRSTTHPGRWDLSSLVMVSRRAPCGASPSSSACSRHHPGMLLVDAFSSSEALGMGMSVSGGGAAQDGDVHARARRQGADRGRPRGGARLRGDRRARARRPQPARLLQGRGEVGRGPSR